MTAIMTYEDLVAHMQDACRNYLEPTTYKRRRPGAACPFDGKAEMPHANASEEGRAAARRTRDEMFIADLIYFLDSAEHGTDAPLSNFK